jgi:hypothetical protein
MFDFPKIVGLNLEVKETGPREKWARTGAMGLWAGRSALFRGPVQSNFFYPTII